MVLQVQGGLLKSSLIRVEEEIPIASSNLQPATCNLQRQVQQQHLSTSGDTCSTCKIDKVS